MLISCPHPWKVKCLIRFLSTPYFVHFASISPILILLQWKCFIYSVTRIFLPSAHGTHSNRWQILGLGDTFLMDVKVYTTELPGFYVFDSVLKCSRLAFRFESHCLTIHPVEPKSQWDVYSIFVQSDTWQILQSNAVCIFYIEGHSHGHYHYHACTRVIAEIRITILRSRSLFVAAIVSPLQYKHDPSNDCRQQQQLIELITEWK